MLLALLLVAPALSAPLPVRFESDEKVVLDAPADDVFAFARQITAGAGISDNGFLFGEEVVIDGPVVGDLFVMAADLRIRGPVGGDVYVFAGNVQLEPGAAIGGHLYAFGGNATLEGPIGGDVTAGAGRLELASLVAGDVSAEVGELTLRDGAGVGGDLDYTAQSAVSGLDDIVGGTVTFTQAVEETETPEVETSSALGDAWWWGVWTVWEYATKLAVGAVLLLLGGAAASRVGRTLVEDPGRSLGLGFTVSSVALVASTVALATVVLFPLGALGLTALFVALYVGQLAAAQALGDVLLRRFRPEAFGSPIVSLAVGLLPLVLASALPWVGWLAWYVATMFGIGAAWMQLRSLARA
jgi:cytoskeletal protein CcmA (bactofilin family)